MTASDNGQGGGGSVDNDDPNRAAPDEGVECVDGYRWGSVEAIDRCPLAGAGSPQGDAIDLHGAVSGRAGRSRRLGRPP